MELESLGIMSEAYRVSRREILEWINNILELSVEKIEQLGTAAVYCQLFEAHFPKSLKLSQVNWMAKSEHEFVANFKILQKGFKKRKFKKVIEVKKLVACKYQDNLEFIQWLKHILSKYGKICDEYNPKEERNNLGLFYKSKNQKAIQKQYKKNKANFKKLSSNTSKTNKVYIPGESQSNGRVKRLSKVVVEKEKKVKLSNVDKEFIEQLKMDMKFVKDVLKKKVEDRTLVKELRNYFMIDVEDSEEEIDEENED